MPLRAKVMTGVLMSLRGKTREGEESPDAPMRKSARRRLPDFTGLLCQLFKPLQSGVQLGRIA